jgi:deoxyribodipyrimidine photo-lyase
MNVLVWFKRDLRIHDHAALAMAAEIGPVLPLYMIEPPYWQLPDTSARQWEFTAEALQDLRAALGAIGAPLILRTGDAVDILARFCRDHQISRIISHAETGNLWTYGQNCRNRASCAA